jgi:hypothetical protein
MDGLKKVTDGAFFLKNNLEVGDKSKSCRDLRDFSGICFCKNVSIPLCFYEMEGLNGKTIKARLF